MVYIFIIQHALDKRFNTTQNNVFFHARREMEKVCMPGMQKNVKKFNSIEKTNNAMGDYT